MAYVSSAELPRYAPERSRFSIPRLLASSLRVVGDPLRKRWVYHSTLAALQVYSERNLRDIGADQDIDTFARSAAGLA